MKKLFILLVLVVLGLPILAQTNVDKQDTQKIDNNGRLSLEINGDVYELMYEPFAELRVCKYPVYRNDAIRGIYLYRNNIMVSDLIQTDTSTYKTIPELYESSPNTFYRKTISTKSYVVTTDSREDLSFLIKFDDCFIVFFANWYKHHKTREITIMDTFSTLIVLTPDKNGNYKAHSYGELIFGGLERHYRNGDEYVFQIRETETEVEKIVVSVSSNLPQFQVIKL